MNTGEIEELIATLEAWDKWELGCGRPVLRKLQHSETAAAIRFLLKEREWKPINLAPKTKNFIGAVDGDWRVVGWHKTSHVPLYGWCLMDQGAEDCDLCKPTHFFEVPEPPSPPQSQGDSTVEEAST